MSVVIHIPTPLRPFTDKLDTVEVSGTTVGEALLDLTTRYAGLRQHLYAPDGRLRSFVKWLAHQEGQRWQGYKTFKKTTLCKSSAKLYKPLHSELARLHLSTK